MQGYTMPEHTSSVFYLVHLGCAKNQVDAEVMTRYLHNEGWKPAESPEDADYIIVNSCGFIRPAKEESIETTLQLRERYPGKKIILAGCLAQRYGAELSALYGTVDGIFGNRALSEIHAFLRRLKPGATEVFTSTHAEEVPERDHLFNLPGSAYLKVSEGCNNRCSFCAIPLIRGNLRSRSIEDILGELRGLLRRGVFEINLIGQDLGAYGSDLGNGGVVELLKNISALPGKFWIRLLYIHPDHFPRDMLDVIGADPRILPYFDIPFQHASDRVLARMNRRGHAAEYLGLVRDIRASLPDAVIRTTFLVGFPGERRKDFAVLREFQHALSADWLGVFTYSREEGTPAASMGRLRPLPGRTAEGRRKILMETQEDITAHNLERFKGRVLPVLVEEQVEGEDLALGRIYAQAPEVDGLTVVHTAEADPGQVLNCKITGVRGYDLQALPV